jgi:hypothetical protein
MLFDWVAALEPLTKRGWGWGVDGKFRLAFYTQPSDTPWLHSNNHIPGSREAGVDCGLLHIYHNQIFKQQGVHSFCMGCYKVVVKPKTLEQVHKIADWQQLGEAKNWACKVGAERRNYTDRDWGAYFYCRGVEEGRERFKAVRKWVDENLGEDIVVILKRGCTEFENNMGASDKWEMLPQQLEVEEEGRKLIDYTPMGPPQAAAIQHHVYDVWDDWNRQTRKPVTYHEEDKVEE